ncbi:MAG: hypothetical protein HY286_04015 [Planctomycetes bacterium]|nr:hypothetical protein [Planctomycetota bacterium]
MAVSKSPPPLKPAETLSELTKLLKAAPPKVCISMNAASARGDEPFLHELLIRRIAAFAESRGSDVNRYDAAVPGFNAPGLYSELTTRSLFAAATVRILKNADALIKKSGEADDDESESDALAEEGEKPSAPKRSREAAVHPLEKAVLLFIKSAPEGDMLAVTGKKFRAPFVRAAREAGAFVAEFRPLYDKPFRGPGPVDGTEFGEFAIAIAKEMGLKLAAGALGSIVKKTGSQLSQVAGALEKLRSVANGAEITTALVAAQIPYSRPGSPWALAEAVLSGDASRALVEIESLENAGARDTNGKIIAADGAYVMAFSAIARDGRRNLAASEYIKNGMSISEAASALGVPPFPAALEAFERQVRSRTPAGHRYLFNWVAEAEFATRMRGEKAKSALERLACRARSRESAAK